MNYHVIRLGRALPGAEKRVELCYDKGKTTVWLQLTNTESLTGGLGSDFVTCLIGAVQKPGGWAAIDPGTAARLRDVTLAFGNDLGDRIEVFQAAITRDWTSFNGARAAQWAKGITGGKDLSNPSFVMKAIKTGFDAIGVAVPAYSGLQMRGYTVDDTIGYLKKRAAMVASKVIDGALIDFLEIGPDPNHLKKEDPAKNSDTREIDYINADRSGAHSGAFAYPELTAAVPFKRVIAYGFRGDTRMPSLIKNAGGFNNNYTRPDHIQKALDKGMAHDRALDLPAFLLDQFYGGYISVSRSYAVAKAFATGLTNPTRSAGWVYVCFVEGGFLIPKKGWFSRISQNTSDSKIDDSDIYIKYNEREIAMPGVLDWDDVVACRAVSISGVFEGNVFIRKSTVQQDPHAASEIYRLLSGETQGPGL